MLSIWKLILLTAILSLVITIFNMNAGVKTVKILEGKPENIRLRSVYDIQ